jgi:hypothetical protein
VKVLPSSASRLNIKAARTAPIFGHVKNNLADGVFIEIPYIIECDNDAQGEASAEPSKRRGRRSKDQR